MAGPSPVRTLDNMKSYARWTERAHLSSGEPHHVASPPRWSRCRRLALVSAGAHGLLTNAVDITIATNLDSRLQPARSPATSPASGGPTALSSADSGCSTPPARSSQSTVISASCSPTSMLSARPAPMPASTEAQVESARITQPTSAQHPEPPAQRMLVRARQPARRTATDALNSALTIGYSTRSRQQPLGQPSRPQPDGRGYRSPVAG